MVDTSTVSPPAGDSAESAATSNGDGHPAGNNSSNGSNGSNGSYGSYASRAGRAVREARERLWIVAAPALVEFGPTAKTVRQDLVGAFGHLRPQRHVGKLLGAAAVALYVLSGTYLVSPGEQAVVTRFGAVVQPRVAPGLRWRLPWPFEAARTVDVAGVRREGIGLTFPGHSETLHPPEDIQLLTGDENLLVTKAIVQYRIKEPADYLFRVDYNEDPLLRATITAALTAITGGMPVDAVLTSGRTAVQQRVREQVQRQLDVYRSGIEVVSIDLQEVAPPGDVAGAFRDVSSAAEEKNRLVNDAQGYANSVVPQARGEAERRLREAEGYRTDVVNRAGGEAQRFADTVAQYQRDSQIFGPAVTRYRLYIETMERVLPRARKYVVEPATSGGSVSIRIIEPLPTNPNPPPQSTRP